MTKKKQRTREAMEELRELYELWKLSCRNTNGEYRVSHPTARSVGESSVLNVEELRGG